MRKGINLKSIIWGKSFKCMRKGINLKSITWGKSFKCMRKGINLTNLCTRLDIFFLPSVTLILPLQSWIHHEMTHNIILYRWTHFIMLLKCYKSTAVIQLKLQTVKISDYIFIFKFILLSISYSLSLYHLTNVIIPLECY